MPWNRESVMDQKITLVAEWHSGLYSKTQLAARHGLSRPTLDKWLARYAEQGVDGLKEASRRPSSCPAQTSDHVLQLLLEQKRHHPAWGPKKLVALLQREHPEMTLPAPSTAGEWLRKFGLVKVRRQFNRPPTGPKTMRPADEPNQTWAADFKGSFKLKGGQRCHPLTITDHASRFLLLCKAQPDVSNAREGFEWAFHEFGLPDVIRTDNGSPFASTGFSRLSSLSVWWIRLGIFPELIQLGRPDQNGRHERMHRTLKDDLLCAPETTLIQQQLAFERFREEFNYVRPHEALDMMTPARIYTPSVRQYHGKVPEYDYSSEDVVRRVRLNGHIKWKGKSLFLSEALIGEAVGMREVDDEVWDLYLCNHRLGRLERGAKRFSSL